MASMTLISPSQSPGVGSCGLSEILIDSPPPPPPSPTSGSVESPGLIDEQLLLHHFYVGPYYDRPSESTDAPYPTHSPIFQRSPHPQSPLREEILSLGGSDASPYQAADAKTTSHKPPAVSGPKLTGKRRATGATSSTEIRPPGSDQSLTTANGHSSPDTSTTQVVVHPAQKQASTPTKSHSGAGPRPAVNGRQISLPRVTKSSTFAEHISDPRPVPPSQRPSRSGSFSTSESSEGLVKEEKSYFSDSEDDDEKKLTKRARLGGSQGRQNRVSRRRLSDALGEIIARLPCM